MARRILAAGNWKMNMTPAEAAAFINDNKAAFASDDVDVLFCVPAIDLPAALAAAEGTNIKIGAENMYFEEKGAFTGEIAPAMLDDLGVKYVIIGHSERREYFAETCGESLEQREQGVTQEWVRQQVKIGLLGVDADAVKNVVIAYEPIWAIGTGVTATSDQAEEVCGWIRALLVELYGAEVAEEVRVLYGGSVNGGNAAELFAKPNIDGGLVGGASLKPSFADIIHYNK